MKQLKLITVIFSLILILPSYHSINAQPLNVLDCLDNEEDCLELDENDEEEKDENELLEAEQFDNGSIVFNVIKMIFALLLVLLLIYVVVKVISSRQKLNNRVKSLENLGGISVGNNKSIQVVRIGQKFYLVGVGDNVELLKEITENEVIDSLLEEDHSEDSMGSFLTSLLPRKKQQKDKEQNNFKNKFEVELDKIKHHRKTIINQHTEKEDEHD